MSKSVFLVLVVMMLLMVAQFAWAETWGGTVSSVKAGIEPEYRRRVIIDTDQMKISGNRGYWMRDHLASLMRTEIKSTNMVEIAVSGKERKNAVRELRHLHESGLFTTESKKQVPVGTWKGPTDIYSVTATLSYKTDYQSETVYIDGKRVTVSKRKKVATAEIFLEPISLESGLQSQSYRGFGEAKSDEYQGSGFGLGIFASFARTKSMNEDELIRIAAKKAIKQIACSLDPEPIEPVCLKSVSGEIKVNLPDGRKLTLDISSKKKLYFGDHILVTRGKQEIARYAVYKIDGQEVYVEVLSESSRPQKGDSFEIVSQ